MAKQTISVTQVLTDATAAVTLDSASSVLMITTNGVQEFAVEVSDNGTNWAVLSAGADVQNLGGRSIAIGLSLPIGWQLRLSPGEVVGAGAVNYRLVVE